MSGYVIVLLSCSHCHNLSKQHAYRSLAKAGPRFLRALHSATLDRAMNEYIWYERMKLGYDRYMRTCFAAMGYPITITRIAEIKIHQLAPS